MTEAIPGAKFRHGTDEAADGDVDKTIISAPSTGILRVLRGFISVTVAAAGNGGKASLEDGAGGTKFFKVDADAVGYHPFDFGPRGYPLTAATALNLTVDGDGATEATATATVVAYEIG